MALSPGERKLQTDASIAMVPDPLSRIGSCLVCISHLSPS